MPLPVTAAAALAGRLLLAAIFLHEAWSKLTGYSAALAYMQAFGVPGQLLPLAIAVELGCGVLILCGYHTRAAALLLAGFCLVTAVLFHTKFGDRNQLLHWRSPAGFSCCSRTAAAHGPSTRCAHREGEGSRGSGLGKKELPSEARVLVNLLRRPPERHRHCRAFGRCTVEPFAAPRD